VTPVVRILLWATLAFWLVMELRQGSHTRSEAQTADQGSRPALRLTAIVGALGAIVVSRVAPDATIEPVSVAAAVGLVILWCGIGLRLWSFRTLGRYFTFVVQTSRDQPVITSGPYRVIRHPSYAGVLLAVVGIGIIIGNWWSLVVLTAAVAGGIVFRIRVEERALLDGLDDDYREYAATHKRLIPFVW
jgi:protein-S-isoprenylcysteine O-methyltransferase Ste14